MSIEHIFIYTGYLACFAAVFYLFKIGETKIALVFLLGLTLQFQALIFSPLIEPIENLGDCWARTGDHYACTPLAQKLTLHASQLGQYVLAFGIFLFAVRLKKFEA